MIKSVDEYYRDVMEHGTPEAKILMTEEACMSGNLAKRLVQTTLPSGVALAPERHDERAATIQRELMALLHAHRGMVLANFFMERARGEPMGTEGPVVTAQPLMEDGGGA